MDFNDATWFFCCLAICSDLNTFNELKQVRPALVVQRRHAPVIEQQDIGYGSDRATCQTCRWRGGCAIPGPQARPVGRRPVHGGRASQPIENSDSPTEKTVNSYPQTPLTSLLFSIFVHRQTIWTTRNGQPPAYFKFHTLVRMACCFGGFLTYFLNQKS